MSKSTLAERFRSIPAVGARIGFNISAQHQDMFYGLAEAHGVSNKDLFVAMIEQEYEAFYGELPENLTKRRTA